MAVRQQQRRGTAAQWTSANPILSAAEIGYETDTNKFKIGDGTNRWSTLSYFVDLDTMIAGAPGLLNSLDEIAAAINDDPAFFTTIASSMSSKAPIASPTFTGTVSGVTKSMVGLGSVDNTADTAKPVSTAQATAIATAKSEAISTASSDATTKANNAKSGAETTAATALASHESDTTNIHGIANTALLVTQSDLSSALAGATVDQSALAGVGIDWNPTTEAFDIDSTVATETYVDAAQAAAEATASADASSKANAAQSAAATDATSKANAAQSAATSAAATDATTKAATAKSEAISAAATDATTKADAAKAFATAADTTLRTAITTDIATAKSEAITAATNAVNAVIASAPAALDTLDELAAALGDDANYASTITTALSAKAPLSSPALTGNPTAPTQTLGNDSTRVATTAFVKAAIQDISSLNLVLDGGGVE